MTTNLNKVCNRSSAVFRLKDIGEDKEGFFKSLAHNITSGRNMPLSLAMEMFGERLTTSIVKLGGMLARKDDSSYAATTPQTPGLPRVIRFPYARHSSYQELCHFVDAFKPLDVWPCTEDAQHWWRKGMHNSSGRERNYNKNYVRH